MRIKLNKRRFVRLHNAPLIESRFPIGKQLGEPIFTGLSCGLYFAPCFD